MAANLKRVVLLLVVALVTFNVNADDDAPIPSNKGQLSLWLSANVPPISENKNLDPALVAAEADPAKIIKVSKDGSGDFKTITEAVDSVPSGNSKRVIIYIKGGVYQEKVTIDRSKPFITFYGAPNDPPTISYAGTAAQYGTVDSATLIVGSDYFVGVNIIIKNSAPRPDGVRKGAQAVALRVSGNKAAFYKCKMLGYQDTLCDDRGFHFFKDCYIEGTVDFVFGSGTSLYLNTELHVIDDPKMVPVITAQARQSDDGTGYSFVHCTITGTAKHAVLGRAWMPDAKVIFAYTNMGGVISAQGWSDNLHPERDNTVFFGEYQNSGASADESGRVDFAKNLDDAQVEPFLKLKFIDGSTWLTPPPNPQV